MGTGTFCPSSVVFNSPGDRNPSYSGKNDDSRDQDNLVSLKVKFGVGTELEKVEVGVQKEKLAKIEEGKGGVVGQGRCVQVKCKKQKAPHCTKARD